MIKNYDIMILQKEIRTENPNFRDFCEELIL